MIPVAASTHPAVHARSGDAATGIIGLLEVAESDFTKMLADAEVEEETAQKAYEKVSHENKVDTAMKDADIKYSVKEKAGLEKSVADLKDDKEGEQAELDAVTEYFARVRPPQRSAEHFGGGVPGGLPGYPQPHGAQDLSV